MTCQWSPSASTYIKVCGSQFCGWLMFLVFRRKQKKNESLMPFAVRKIPVCDCVCMIFWWGKRDTKKVLSPLSTNGACLTTPGWVALFFGFFLSPVCVSDRTPKLGRWELGLAVVGLKFDLAVFNKNEIDVFTDYHNGCQKQLNWSVWYDHPILQCPFKGGSSCALPFWHHRIGIRNPNPTDTVSSYAVLCCYDGPSISHCDKGVAMLTDRGDHRFTDRFREWGETFKIMTNLI